MHNPSMHIGSALLLTLCLQSAVTPEVKEIRKQVEAAFVDIPPVPEPATLSILAQGGLAVLRRRKRS